MRVGCACVACDILRESFACHLSLSASAAVWGCIDQGKGTGGRSWGVPLFHIFHNSSCRLLLMVQLACSLWLHFAGQCNVSVVLIVCQMSVDWFI